jgi:hypothetical protein
MTRLDARSRGMTQDAAGAAVSRGRKPSLSQRVRSMSKGGEA